jgi:YesN/AraC family two-component response regulator
MNWQKDIFLVTDVYIVLGSDCVIMKNDKYINIHYVYSGKIVMQLNEQKCVLTVGQLIFIRPDCGYFFDSSSKDDVILSIQMEQEDMKIELLSDSFVGKVNLESPFTAVWAEYSKFTYLIFDFSLDRRMMFLFEELYREYVKPSLLSHELVENYLRIIVLLLTQNYRSKKAPSFDHLITAMLNYIDAHFSHCTLAELAKQFNFHPKYVGFLLKEKTGSTFSEIITQAKMKTVCSLLRNTNKSIREISELCGYSNQTFFYQKFMAIYQMTPKQYRDEYQTKTTIKF